MEYSKIKDLHKGEAMRLCKSTTTIEEVVELTKHSDPRVRKTALVEMCPCRVKTDIDDFWTRVLEMLDDPSELVRYQVLHTLCDGSPAHLEMDVVAALEKFNRDPDKHIRRQAHRALAAYHRTGKWNIL